jgi:Peptidase family C78
LCGTEHWIGATECAALLRYFGIRAVIVDFSMDKEERTNRAAKLKLTLERRNKTMYNKKRRKNDEGYPPKKNVKNKNIKISHNQSTTTLSAIDTNTNIDRYDNQSDDYFEKDDGAILSNGNGIKNDSSLHGNTSINSDVYHQNASQNHREGYQELNSTSKHLNSDILINQNKHDNMNRIDEEEEKNSNVSMSERVFNWVKRYHASNKVTTDAGSVAMGGSVSCSKVKKSVLIPRNTVINIDTDDDDDDIDNNGNDSNNHSYNDNNSKNNNSSISNNTTRSANDNDETKEKNSSVLPLFFQHQGHSRTIIGMEPSWKKCFNLCV